MTLVFLLLGFFVIVTIIFLAAVFILPEWFGISKKQSSAKDLDHK